MQLVIIISFQGKEPALIHQAVPTCKLDYYSAYNCSITSELWTISITTVYFALENIHSVYLFFYIKWLSVLVLTMFFYRFYFCFNWYNLLNTKMKGLKPLELFIGVLVWGGVAVTQPGPCDRSRRVLTAPRGVLSTGPAGANYTQVSQ